MDNIERKSDWGKDTQTCLRAIRRFETKIRPMGIPEDIDPEPETIEIEWPINPVPLDVQKIIGKLIVKRGEFGFLEEERVDEIAQIIEKYPIGIEQALSLRSAINQEKSVYSHRRIMDQKKELRRRYENGTGILELAKESEHPRSYEVAGQLIKNVADVTEKLGDLQEKMKKLKEVPNSAPKNVTNALFVGSTAELQKMLKGN